MYRDETLPPLEWPEPQWAAAAPAETAAPRWDRIFAPILSAEAHIRSGNAVKPLIDGRRTFLSMVEDIRAARDESDFIYLLGWDIVDDFNLAPRMAPIPTSFAALMREADARGVQIRVMLWAKPPLGNRATVNAINRLAHGGAIRDDLTANNRPLTNAQIRQLLVSAGISAPVAAATAATLLARRNIPALLGAHHQKVMIIKRGDQLVAYCGGVDINRNRLDAVSATDPQHDAHCRMVGPSAWDLLQTFIKRWSHHPGSTAIDSAKGALLGIGLALPGAIAAPPTGDAPYGGTSSVVIGRTFNPNPNGRTGPAIVRERDIQQLVLAAINNAERFIYIEDQYLIDLDVAAAINRALSRVNHVTILIPGNDITSGGHPFIQEYRRDFIDRATAGLSATDAAKLFVYQLSSSQRSPTFGNHTYVHAKTWVIDDDLAIIGSANCNRRGYQHDSETSAFIWGTTSGWNGASSMAQAYRMELWAEHLGLPLSSLTDGDRDARHWRAGARTASARVIEFDHHLSPGLAQSVRDGVAAALRPLIDPVP
jgi:phosphatidylserine/phosphatidylglycerophosphate/cardiolipin synthase-like enzyme